MLERFVNHHHLGRVSLGTLRRAVDLRIEYACACPICEDVHQNLSGLYDNTRQSSTRGWR
uniref:Uncharacterized protein n=1 Tax=Arion vulgaris TaxID=1028688 RepID=A0A0B6Z7X5_9EUPU